MTNFEHLQALGQDITVLYVEDDQTARNQTKKLLNRIFMNLDVAENGQEGFSLFKKQPHDLIISDIMMNIMDGLEMVRLIKEINNEQNIIFLSAYTELKFFIKAIEFGVDGFVFKPLEIDKFYDILLKSVKHILIKKENADYKHNLEQQVKDRTQDLHQRNKQLKEMIKEIKKANHLKEEMKIAQKVQENFLPKEILQSKKMNIATFFEAAEYVGGDYYDLFEGQNNEINIIIADVSGHGVVPAITMSTFRGVCRSILTLDMKFEDQVFTINNIMSEDAKRNDFFITAFFIKYYEDENRFEYISAGHNEIIYYNQQKDSFEKLESTAIPLAIFKDTLYKPVSKTLHANDFLTLYTDGLIEATNTQKKMFGLKTLINILEGSKDQDVEIILFNIQTVLQGFIKDIEKGDDTTILIAKFT